MIHPKIKVSKCFIFIIYKHVAYRDPFVPVFLNFLGFCLSISIFISIHSFYLAVRRKLLSSRSFSLSNAEITMPTKRFRIKKEPNIIKKMKKARYLLVVMG